MLKRVFFHDHIIEAWKLWVAILCHQLFQPRPTPHAYTAHKPRPHNYATVQFKLKLSFKFTELPIRVYPSCARFFVVLLVIKLKYKMETRGNRNNEKLLWQGK
jgi:hypothetical protein